MIESCFPPEYVAVVPGGRGKLAFLISCFSSSSLSAAPVGRFVMEKAARHDPRLPGTGRQKPLHRGQHRPCAPGRQRIVFGKCLNAGQTCVAPDYVLVDRASRTNSAARPSDIGVLHQGPAFNPAYPRIVNQNILTASSR
ncbi:MAG: hypothetical protein ACLUVV_05955 [Christensenellales bacterium]